MQKCCLLKVDNSGEEKGPKETTTYQILGQARVGPAKGRTRQVCSVFLKARWMLHPSETTQGLKGRVTLSAAPLYTMIATASQN